MRKHVFLALISGEKIVSKVIEEDTDTITLEDPLAVQPTLQRMKGPNNKEVDQIVPQMFPWLLFSTINNMVKIKKSTIIAREEPTMALIQNYTALTSPIDQNLPPGANQMVAKSKGKATLS